MKVIRKQYSQMRRSPVAMSGTILGPDGE